MILEVIPVLPPDLRPLVPLEGGRFATSDLNDLYRRVINRNNRLKKLMDIKAPEVILRNEKRMLQEAVDALFDNGRRSRAVRGQGNRPLKSLSDMLKGKQGRFRQNLLGKRVDYSGRSVIVVGPELKLHQCGLPKNMALELFKPFIIRKLEDRGYVQTVKSAKRLVEREKPEVWDILGEIIREPPGAAEPRADAAPPRHPGLRAGAGRGQGDPHPPAGVPGVQRRLRRRPDGGARAALVRGADRGAPAHAVDATTSCRRRNGRPLATPTQDIVLGCHYLTKDSDRTRAAGERATTRFCESRPTRCARRYDNGEVDLHAKITCAPVDEPGRRSACSSTTAGRVLFNEVVPQELGFINETHGQEGARDTWSATATRKLGARDDVGAARRAQGPRASATRPRPASRSASTTCAIPPEKDEIIDARATGGRRRSTQTTASGVITEGERYNKVIDTWTHATTEVEEVTFDGLSQDRDGFNPIFMMADSGSRGNREQVRQLAGMRGLMAKPQKKITGGIGEIIESPVIHNFKEGLTVLEYFISTHGARKGLADTALKTADAGYLTRRLVDVAQDVIINEHDCGTIRGLSVGRAQGRRGDHRAARATACSAASPAEDVIHPISNEMHRRGRRS